jgi:hypothetical protein
MSQHRKDDGERRLQWAKAIAVIAAAATEALRLVLGR